jgi:hypothetical protein
MKTEGEARRWPTANTSKLCTVCTCYYIKVFYGMRVYVDNLWYRVLL